MHENKVQRNDYVLLDFFCLSEKNLTFFLILYSNHTLLSSVGAERGIYQISLYAERGCDNMKPTSFETIIRLQFDTLVKRVIDCTVKDYEKELHRRERREVLFCELPDIVVQSFAIEDDYDLIEKICFVACGIEILVQKSELSTALEKLPEVKRNVLLLSYFEELSDAVIAELMDVTRNGIYKRRQAALRLMKELLQEE
ncbi:RNA polymerase sigma factor [Longibaculum muris]|uniref:RNA polymerase sigma factor n=2 Tax=Bacillota TaxID=1239 RepID=UPI001E336508|nr:sigma factor-like helix-turn-helix DNA-binding protein [Longibaculum muris]